MLIGRMVCDTGDDFGMCGLDEECADSPDHYRYVANDLPSGGARPEEPRIAPIVQRLRERIIGFSEERHRVGCDSAPQVQRDAILDLHGAIVSHTQAHTFGPWTDRPSPCSAKLCLQFLARARR